MQEVPALVSDGDMGNGSDKETEVREVREVMAMASLDTAEDMVPEGADTETSVMGPLTSYLSPSIPMEMAGSQEVGAGASEDTSPGAPGTGCGWRVVSGQLIRILTSQPGNWNGWIFCTTGDGATMVLYSIHIHPYTTTSVSTVQL